MMSEEGYNLDTDEGRTQYKEALIEQINNGNALEFMTSCDGWEILINSLRAKKENQIEILMGQPPGNDQDILRLHAIAFSVAHTIDDVSASVYNAIQNGKTARIALAELNNQIDTQE